MVALLVPLLLLAALGFALSVAAHIASIAGITLPGGKAVWLLHIGVFVVWLPTVVIAIRVTRGERRKDFWKVVLSGCPPWMRGLAYGLIAYAVVNFIYFVVTATAIPKGHHIMSGDPPPAIIRGFSGHWMIFYGAAFMTLYSVVMKRELLRGKFCPRGHAISVTDEFCPQCGESLAGVAGR